MRGTVGAAVAATTVVATSVGATVAAAAELDVTGEESATREPGSEEEQAAAKRLATDTAMNTLRRVGIVNLPTDRPDRHHLSPECGHSIHSWSKRC